MKTKKIKGSVVFTRPTFGGGRKAICLIIRDETSRTTFAEIELPYESFTEALFGSTTDCEITLRGLKNLGKIKETEIITYAIDLQGVSYSDRKEVAYQGAIKYLAQSGLSKQGWVAKNYFGSKDSFFEKDGIQYASTVAHRYIEPGE